MTEEQRNLDADLMASLDVLERHFRRAKANAEAEGSELSELECAIGNVIQLVPLLAEDYHLSWDLMEVARNRIKELEDELKQAVGKIVLPHVNKTKSGLVLPT